MEQIVRYIFFAILIIVALVVLLKVINLIGA